MGEVVKINGELLERVGKVIEKKEIKIKYSSKKQFVDIAVLELLKREENK